MFHRRFSGAVILACASVFLSQISAQSSAPAPQTQTSAPATQPTEPATPHGRVLYQSHGDAPATPDQQQAAPQKTEKQAPANATPQLTDADRSAIRVTRYDLDVRIVPATSRLTGRARLTLRNTTENPLPRIALQISSTLTWESASVQGSVLPVAQHLLDTDADHTGRARELILTLPKPLAPGESLTLDTFYSGTITANGERLERLGAPASQALATDWDAITSNAIALRGFGNVLWFPAAAPQLFLQDGSLVPAVGRGRLEHADTSVSLRLSIEFSGEAPTAAYFCGRRQPLAALHDNADAPIAYGSGVATATFPAEPIGPRPLSLFVIAQPENMIAPLPSASSGQGKPGSGGQPMLAVESADDRELPLLAESAERVAPLLQQWFGPHPLTALTIIDHAGQPFEDGPLLVAPIGTLAAASSTPLLAHSLTHAWVQTGQPWMDEGLAQFFSLLWIEHEKGRDAAVGQLDDFMQPVAAADTLNEAAANASTNPAAPASSSNSESSVVGQPLIVAYDELFFRRKAAAVWWMLRDIVGEQPLQLALSAWRTQKPGNDSPEAQAQAFEALLEKITGKDLAWFFNDWVLHDRGLPSLSIVDVTPRELPAGTGHGQGWLVAVTAHNAGAAAVEVPLVIRSGTFSTTKRIRIPGLSNSTERVVVESAPTEVILNDGSAPEAGPSTHTRTVVIHQD